MNNKYSELSNSEIGRQIAERVMGWSFPKHSVTIKGGRYDIVDSKGEGRNVVPQFSADETTFFRDVAPKARELGIFLFIDNGDKNKWHVEGYNEEHLKNITPPPLSVVMHKSLARAGCEAALLALDELEGK